MVAVPANGLPIPIGTAFFTRMRIEENDLPSDKIVDEEFMEAIAHETDEILVSAYDREGLVIWSEEPGECTKRVID